MTANDISRWCTVWSLLERNTYVIDECPWQTDTQDKVEHAPKGGGGADGGQGAVKHFYSSKPALISTMIAGILYPGAEAQRRAAGSGLSPGAGRGAGLRRRIPTIRANSRACSRLPRTRRNGRHISSTSSRCSSS